MTLPAIELLETATKIEDRQAGPAHQSWTPPTAGLRLLEGVCFMSSMRSYTPEFREAAVALVKSQGLSIRKAADRLGISFHTLDNWIRRGRPKRTVQVPSGSPKTLAEAAARVRSLEADVRRLTLEREILKKAAAYFAKEQS